MNGPLSPKRFADRYPVGTTMVVDETSAKGYLKPTYWVGVITEHWRSPLAPHTPAGLPVLTLAAKPAAAHLSDWWIIGKGYQHDQRDVISLDAARERFGGQPEFREIPLCPACSAGLNADGTHLWGGDHA